MEHSLSIWSIPLLIAILLGGILLLRNLTHSLKPWTRCVHRETVPLPHHGYRSCKRCGAILDEKGRELSSHQISEIARSVESSE